MEFVIISSILVGIAMIIGRISNRGFAQTKVVNEYLYDERTVEIMKAYMLIDDAECRLMLDNLKNKE